MLRVISKGLANDAYKVFLYKDGNKSEKTDDLITTVVSVECTFEFSRKNTIHNYNTDIQRTLNIYYLLEQFFSEKSLTSC